VDSIHNLASTLGVTRAELVETAIAKMSTQAEQNRVETIKEIRECIQEADTRLARLERGQA
jgi:hypothetical protein